MRILSSWLCLIAVFLSASNVFAQDALLDLLPEGACCFAIRNLESLKKKGDKFLKDTEIPMNPRPSEIADQIYRQLNLVGAVEENAPAALMIFGTEYFKRNLGPWARGIEKLVVGVVRIKSAKIVEKNFNLAPGTLKPGKVVNLKRRRPFGAFLYLKGKNLYLGDDAEVVKYAAEKAKRLAPHLTANQKKSVKDSDMVLHLAVEAWGTDITNGLFINLRGSARLPKDPEEKKLMKNLLEALKDVGYVLATARIDDGLGLNFVAGLKNKASQKSKDLLALFRSGSGVSNLSNLPKGTLVAAHGVRGDGKATGMLSKVMLNLFFQEVLEAQKIISATERPLFVGIFKEVWQRLQGSKTGVYINTQSKKHGLFSFLAVLDSKDAKELLKEMKILAKIAEGKIDLTKKAEEGGEVDIEKLVKNLGSSRYRVRQLATFKIRLIGEPALPYLAEAQKDADNLELVLRARGLATEINLRLAERRKAALSKNPFERIRPTFVMASNVEKRAGHDVDVIRIILGDGEKVAEKQMAEIFGPQWNNMRVAVHKDQVVVLLGSNLELFDQTLKNISQKQPGLAASKSLTELYRYSKKSRKFELHVSVQNIFGIIMDIRNPQQPVRPSTSLTSIGLSIEPNQLQLDVWLPVDELRVAGRIFR